MTTGFFRRTQIFVIKRDAGSHGALLLLRSVRLRLITLPSTSRWRSFWPTLVDFRVCFYLHLFCGHTSTKTTYPPLHTADFNPSQYSKCSCRAQSLSEHLEQIKQALHSAVNVTQGLLPSNPQKWWVSWTVTALLGTPRSTPWIQHTMRRADPSHVNWPRVWEMNGSSGRWESVGKWKQLRLSEIGVTLTDWLRKCVHGSQS